MVDVDTFLTTLYVMVDDFCKTSLPPETHPGPEAALSRSETVPLAIFGQWQGFGSERGFYRYAQRHVRPAFPQLPTREQFNRQVLWAGASSTPHASRRRRIVLAAVPRQFELLYKETIATGDKRLPAHRPIGNMLPRQRVQPQLELRFRFAQHDQPL